jgi:hypothetical protein
MMPLLSAFVVFLLVALAEWLHVRRIRVAARLAFGPAGAARPWTCTGQMGSGCNCLTKWRQSWVRGLGWIVHASHLGGIFPERGFPRQRREQQGGEEKQNHVYKIMSWMDQRVASLP